MRPARIIAAILFAAAVAVTGWTASSIADRPAATAQPPAAASPREPVPHRQATARPWT